jgi:hypothetical protein
MDSDAAQLRPVHQIFSKNGNKNGSASRFARGRQQQAIPIRHAFGRAASASAARTALEDAAAQGMRLSQSIAALRRQPAERPFFG